MYISMYLYLCSRVYSWPEVNVEYLPGCFPLHWGRGCIYVSVGVKAKDQVCGLVSDTFLDCSSPCLFRDRVFH